MNSVNWHEKNENDLFGWSSQLCQIFNDACNRINQIDIRNIALTMLRYEQNRNELKISCVVPLLHPNQAQRCALMPRFVAIVCDMQQQPTHTRNTFIMRIDLMILWYYDRRCFHVHNTWFEKSISINRSHLNWWIVRWHCWCYASDWCLCAMDYHPIFFSPCTQSTGQEHIFKIKSSIFMLVVVLLLLRFFFFSFTGRFWKICDCFIPIISFGMRRFSVVSILLLSRPGSNGRVDIEMANNKVEKKNRQMLHAIVIWKWIMNARRMKFRRTKKMKNPHGIYQKAFWKQEIWLIRITNNIHNRFVWD